jgi:hypothetical protein
MPHLIYRGKTLLTSKGRTSLVKEEDNIPRGGVVIERSMMGIADGVFWLGGAHLGWFKLMTTSSIVLSWEDDLFDVWREDRFWRGVVAGAGG